MSMTPRLPEALPADTVTARNGILAKRAHLESAIRAQCGIEEGADLDTREKQVLATLAEKLSTVSFTSPESYIRKVALLHSMLKMDPSDSSPTLRDLDYPLSHACNYFPSETWLDAALNATRHLCALYIEDPNRGADILKQFFKALERVSEKNYIPRREITDEEYAANCLGYTRAFVQLYEKPDRIKDENIPSVLYTLDRLHFINRDTSRFPDLVQFAVRAGHEEKKIFQLLIASHEVVADEKGSSPDLGDRIITHVMPFLKDHSEFARAIREGFNIFSSKEGYGLGNFVALCLASRTTPQTINELCWMARSTPSLHPGHFNQNRQDALLVSRDYPGLRKLIHYQFPNANLLLEAIINHYDKRTSNSRAMLNAAIEKSARLLSWPIAHSLAEDAIDTLNAVTENGETNITVIRRLARNTRPISQNLPVSNSDTWDTALLRILSLKHKPVAEVLTNPDGLHEINMQLHDILAGSCGIHPAKIQGLLIVEAVLLKKLQEMTFEDRERLPGSKLCGEILLFRKLTTSADDIHEKITLLPDPSHDMRFLSSAPCEAALREMAYDRLLHVSALASRYRREGNIDWADGLLSGTLEDAFCVLLDPRSVHATTAVGARIQKERALGQHPGD